MSREKELIRREFLSRKELLVGTVVGERRPDRFDGTAPGAGVMWVCDVEIGSNNPLLNVPIKAGADGGRFFSGLGQTVLLRRNLLGRYQVVGPGDRVAGQMEIIEYGAVSKDVVVQTQQGFAQVIDPFEFYQGSFAMVGNPSITFGLNTITRTVGSFTDEGFAGSDSIDISSPLNSQTLTVSSVTALVMTFGGSPFVVEGPITGVRIGIATTSRWNDGVLTFPSRRIENAAGLTIIPS